MTQLFEKPQASCQSLVFPPSRNMIQIHVMFVLTFSPFLYEFLAFESIKRVNSKKCCGFKVLGQRLEILKGGGTVLQEFHQWFTDALRICLHEFFYYWHYSSFPDIKLCDVWPPEIRAASKKTTGQNWHLHCISRKEACVTKYEYQKRFVCIFL